MVCDITIAKKIIRPLLRILDLLDVKENYRRVIRNWNLLDLLLAIEDGNLGRTRCASRRKFTYFSSSVFLTWISKKIF